LGAPGILPAARTHGAAMQRLRSDLRFDNGALGFPCLIEHCTALHPTVADEITKPQLTITGYWWARPAPLHACQL
jgi:hypothetical protein